jgi:hypothetical protein
MSRKKSTSSTELPVIECVFRYWVELSERQTGAVRKLPLSAVAKIPLTDPPRPREDFLKLQDGTVTLEAKNIDDLAAQLRDRYPDSEYERTLHSERDHEAERRGADAMNRLIHLLAEIVVKDAFEQIDR